MDQKQPFYNRIWFLWVIFTILSFLSYFLFFNGPPPTGFLYEISVGITFIGLFTPIVSGFLSLFALILIFWAIEITASKLKITSPFKRLGINLLLLFFLTIAFDFAISGEWSAYTSLNCSIHFYSETIPSDCIPRDVVIPPNNIVNY